MGGDGPPLAAAARRRAATLPRAPGPGCSLADMTEAEGEAIEEASCIALRLHLVLRIEDISCVLPADGAYHKDDHVCCVQHAAALSL